MMIWQVGLRFAVVALTVLWVGACSSLQNDASLFQTENSLAGPALKEAQVQFKNRNYGRAEKHFRIAVEKEPSNAEAWLGLAASYDHLKRFDLADKAYDNAKSIVGTSASFFNNIGYSYLLRGDLAQARQNLELAYSMDPDGVYVQNNLQLLNELLSERGITPVDLKHS